MQRLSWGSRNRDRARHHQPTVTDWERLITPFDVIVWSAGAGGGDPKRTYAVDRDAAMTMIDALELFDAIAPRLVMVSFAGARTAGTEDDRSSWHAYVESKKAVDQRRYASELPVTILGPTRLTDEPSKGISLLDAPHNPESTTSRELVAEVIGEAVNREDLLQPNPFEFEDGDADIPKI